VIIRECLANKLQLRGRARPPETEACLPQAGLPQAGFLKNIGKIFFQKILPMFVEGKDKVLQKK